MNFLAHCVLGALASQTGSEGLIVGGIVGDLYKGAVPDNWPTEIRSGVRLHRRIDAFSNKHLAIRQSCARFPPELRRLAPVLVDIHADLALAGTWMEHVPVAQETFIRHCNGVLGTWRTWDLSLSPSAERFLDYMIENDLLSAYGTWEGVNLCMQGVARRLRLPDLPGPAVAACQSLSEALQSDFDAYFPDLLSEARRFIASELNNEVREQQVFHQRLIFLG